MMSGEVTVDSTLFLTAIVMVVQFLGGWFVKSLVERINRLEEKEEAMVEKINELAIALPSHYVAKTDYQEGMNGIHTVLRRIEEKIDGKADK